MVQRTKWFFEEKNRSKNVVTQYHEGINLFSCGRHTLLLNPTAAEILEGIVYLAYMDIIKHAYTIRMFYVSIQATKHISMTTLNPIRAKGGWFLPAIF
jgi:hypothetical protein